jgi:hypothetical protein
LVIESAIHFSAKPSTDLSILISSKQRRRRRRRRRHGASRCGEVR